jgi:predicted proteasome-type protease
MTYCVGIMVDGGLILASDSRTHAGVANFASFCRMTVFASAGDRVIVLLSSGNLGGTQSVITPETALNDPAKCALVSFLSTMRSNLSVGMPIDMICYTRDSLEVRMRRRFEPGDGYVNEPGRQWSEDTRQAFGRLPDLQWTR